MFRQTLLCRAEQAIDRTPRPAVVEGLAFSTQAQVRGERGPERLTFESPTGSTLTTDHPLVIAALRAGRAQLARRGLGSRAHRGRTPSARRCAMRCCAATPPTSSPSTSTRPR